VNTDCACEGVGGTEADSGGAGAVDLGGKGVEGAEYGPEG